MPGEPSAGVGIGAGHPPAGSKHSHAWLETSLALVPACCDTLLGTDPEKKKKKAFHRFDEELKGEVGDNPAFSQAGAGRCDPIIWASMAQWVSLCKGVCDGCLMKPLLVHLLPVSGGK